MVSTYVYVYVSAYVCVDVYVYMIYSSENQKIVLFSSIFSQYIIRPYIITLYRRRLSHGQK
jgi:hypothetical protein